MPLPVNESSECELCGGYAKPGEYCFAVYLHNPEAEAADEARPPDAFVHAQNKQKARRVLLETGNHGVLTSPFGITNLWDYTIPRKRLPAHIELCQQ